MFIWCQFQLANDGPESVCVKDILLELRNYRMGLIQTVDQLKFSYMAIVEGKDNIFKLADRMRSMRTNGASKNREK